MIGSSINASANCEGLPLGWDRDVQGLFSVNPRALCRPYRAVWVKTQRPGATPQARRVVGWTDRNGGSPCLVQVYLVRWGGRVGWLLCGGNNGLRILAHPQDPDLRTPRDAQLPNGWGVPILFLNRRDIDVFEPERVMDDPAMRRRIRETYQASMSEILGITRAMTRISVLSGARFLPPSNGTSGATSATWGCPCTRNSLWGRISSISQTR
jgi:hypothetical protein